MKGAIVLMLATALVTVGCSGDEAPPQSPERCSAAAPTRSKATDGALALGQGDAAAFTPYEDGQAVSLVHGPQGGFMITPVLQADRAETTSDGRCVSVHLTAAIDGLPATELGVRLSEVTVDASHLTTDALPFLLSFDPSALVGKASTVSASLEDDGVAWSGEASIVLVQ
jgi:hypothetical protein